jgi:hypothetical protein
MNCILCWYAAEASSIKTMEGQIAVNTWLGVRKILKLLILSHVVQADEITAYNTDFFSSGWRWNF